MLCEDGSRMSRISAPKSAGESRSTVTPAYSHVVPAHSTGIEELAGWRIHVVPPIASADCYRGAKIVSSFVYAEVVRPGASPVQVGDQSLGLHAPRAPALIDTCIGRSKTRVLRTASIEGYLNVVGNSLPQVAAVPCNKRLKALHLVDRSCKCIVGLILSYVGLDDSLILRGRGNCTSAHADVSMESDVVQDIGLIREHVIAILERLSCFLVHIVQVHQDEQRLSLDDVLDPIRRIASRIDAVKEGSQVQRFDRNRKGAFMLDSRAFRCSFA